jgi:DNA-binding XRE family transcriptional regulator
MFKMRIPLPYTVSNNLQRFLKVEQAKRVLQTGERIKLYDIEAELGEYCSLTRDAIYSIKRGTSIASLPVALKIADFFETSVERIFDLVIVGQETNNDDENEYVDLNLEEEENQLTLI